MSSNIKFELNKSGVGQLLRCAEMQQACNNLAAKIQPDKPEFIHSMQGDSRYLVLVHTDTPQETLTRFYGEAEN